MSCRSGYRAPGRGCRLGFLDQVCPLGPRASLPRKPIQELVLWSLHPACAPEKLKSASEVKDLGSLGPAWPLGFLRPAGPPIWLQALMSHAYNLRMAIMTGWGAFLKWI